MSTVGPGLPPLSPTREEFRALAERGNLNPVFAELAADLDTPLSVFLRLRPGPYAFLLESVEGILTGQGKALLANFLALTPVAAPA